MNYDQESGSDPQQQPQQAAPQEVATNNPSPIAAALSGTPAPIAPGVPNAPNPQDAGNPRTQIGPPPPAVAAQIADVKHHSLIGKLATSLLGYDTTFHADPATGQITQTHTQQSPGSLFRHIVAGAILGGAAGSSAPSGNGLASAFRGAGAAMQAQQQQRQAQNTANLQQAQADLQGQQQQRKLAMEQDRVMHEDQVNDATAAMHHAQTLALTQDHEQRSAAWHEKQNAMSQSAIDGMLKMGAHDAQIPLPGGATANGVMTLQEATDAQQAAHQNGTDITQAPDGYTRVFYSMTDRSNISFNGQRWVDASGNAVNMDGRTTVRVLDIPKDQLNEEHPYPISEIRKSIPGFAPNSNGTDNVLLTGHQYLAVQTAGLKNQREKAATEAALAAPAQKAQQLDLEAQRLHIAAVKAQGANDNRAYTQARQGQAAAVRGLQAVATDIGKQIATRQAQIKELDANPRPGTENQRAQLGSEVEALKQQQATVTQQLQDNVARMAEPQGAKKGKRQPAQSAPQQPASTGMVSVVTADGQRGQIPAQNVDAFLRAHPGSQRADQMQLAPAHQPNFTPQQ